MATTITPRIVNLNAKVTKAPTPSQLQRSGALVSVGGTTLTTDTYQFCGQLSEVEGILSSSGNYAELKDMATTFFAQGNTVGVYVLELGSSATGTDAEIALLEAWITSNPDVFYAFLVPSAWDYSKDEVGSVIVSAGGSGYTSAPSVTFSAPTTGTTATGTAIIQNGAVVAVTVTDPGSGYTSAPTVTFSGGAGTGATATANLASALHILTNNHASPTSKLYFFVTTSATNVTNYAAIKSVVSFVAAPTAPSTEFGAAALLYQWLVNNPGAANPLAPTSYRYVYGVTPWELTGNSADINAVLTAYGNLFLTGAEGGISDTCIFKGTTMDGTQMSWWYGVDWFQIQVKQDLASAILNGSNSNPPLLYDQHGINALLSKAQKRGNTAVTYGCALSVDVTAIDFYTYTGDNPGDYTAGIYNGLAATMVGQNGFLTIEFNLDAVQF